MLDSASSQKLRGRVVASVAVDVEIDIIPSMYIRSPSYSQWNSGTVLSLGDFFAAQEDTLLHFLAKGLVTDLAP